jgi:uncharacterized protein DUF5320
MEKARTERVDNQAEDRVPAAKTASRSSRKVRKKNAAVAVAARVKVEVAVADRAVARDAVVEAVKTVEQNPNKEDSIMPGLDRSGPMGAGSMTGGRRGICGRAGVAVNPPAYGSGYGYGRGMGFRRGFGRGRGYGFGPATGGYPYPQAYGTGYPVSKTDEMEMLRTDAEAMRQSLDAIQRRLADLEKEGSE